ncbi:MAG: hypothetical protein QOE92_842 [Chloroflexota bacterium]|jgi:hypothetical protein|nr:hypothetical protein [Chloroflexota bacterium]
MDESRPGLFTAVLFVLALALTIAAGGLADYVSRHGQGVGSLDARLGLIVFGTGVVLTVALGVVAVRQMRWREPEVSLVFGIVRARVTAIGLIAGGAVTLAGTFGLLMLGNQALVAAGLFPSRATVAGLVILIVSGIVFALDHDALVSRVLKPDPGGSRGSGAADALNVLNGFESTDEGLLFIIAAAILLAAICLLPGRLLGTILMVIGAFLVILGFA